MTYCRILLSQLLDAPRLIYLDCEVFVFRNLSEPFDFESSSGKLLAVKVFPFAER
jgi:lipopolysaccharide biosynthesis glycosyltransferase